MCLIFGAVSATMTATIPVEGVVVSHPSATCLTQYQAESTIYFREIESRFCNRPAMPVWRRPAELVLNRAVAAQGQRVDVMRRFGAVSRSHPGSWGAARHSQDRAAETTSVAQQDRAVLVNEIDGIHALSVKGG